ncbi:hypothetical protein C6341_g11223 [Phytophthora cactorum]|nr:hypothetical protein C6341_g11223 [Phytophthora cactorum]
MRGELASSRSPYLEMQFWGDDGAVASWTLATELGLTHYQFELA